MAPTIIGANSHNSLPFQWETSSKRPPYVFLCFPSPRDLSPASSNLLPRVQQLRVRFLPRLHLHSTGQFDLQERAIALSTDSDKR